MAETLINLAVVGPYRSLFTYKIRREDAIDLQKGCRFLAPFGNAMKVAFFVEKQTEPVGYRLRYVRERIDTFSPFPEYLFEFCHWISNYYFAGPGETLAAALPGTAKRKPKLEFVTIERTFFETFDSNNKAAAELAIKFIRGGPVKEDYISRDKALIPVVRDWLQSGVIAPRYRVKTTRKKVIGYRLRSDWAGKDLSKMAEQTDRIQPGNIYTRKQLVEDYGFTIYQVTKLRKNDVLEKVYDESGLTDLTNYPIRYDLPDLELLDGQKRALDEILSAINEKRFEPFMLFGITGSGKTLVYCHAAKRAVEAGGSVLVMVPEIALSGLLLSSFAAFFGDRVAVMHSGLTAGQRYAVREKIASGDIKVVIGPRSTVFSPLNDMRLIIVDEEHDPSYKQDDPAPRYHGRDAAVMLARMVGVPVILGSASPSMESYHNAVTGRYRLLTLDRRPISGYRMPKIKTLDMKSEKISGECSFLSYRLKKETEKHIAAGGQVIYYLNRRGFSPSLKCRECGYVPACPDCGITYTYHRAGRQLKCHFCDRAIPAPGQCDRCGSADFIYVGAGTQRVEENLSRLFADIKAERIDSDRAAGKSGRLILGDFAEEKFNLLIGTQMVTKGLDIPGVTLVGVLSADIGLDMPDFRAAEKTYARLLQVAGRTGRGEREGLVIIQTYYNDHPVIRHLADGDYTQFYESVISGRRELFYPPFSRLINITLTSKDEKLLESQALAFRIKLEGRLAGLGTDRPSSASGNKKTGFYLRLLGPAPAPLYKLRGQFRRRLIIKCSSVKKVLSRFRRWESEEKSFGLPSRISVIFDIDPVNMM
jgi:primosomal protein N' (replication factor Y)